ncbi:MAG: hypothetical protein ACJ74Z_01490 [Bryobacteraceae bacterium]
MIGVSVVMSDRICMGIMRADLMLSTNVTLVSPSEASPIVAVAEIVTRDAVPCPGLKGERQMFFYNLKMLSGSVPAGVAVIALTSSSPTAISAHSFHSCTSADGVHLTAWDGNKALEGHRLWHGYYYIGQDLEPDCTVGETAP